MNGKRLWTADRRQGYFEPVLLAMFGPPRGHMLLIRNRPVRRPISGRDGRALDFA